MKKCFILLLLSGFVMYACQYPIISFASSPVGHDFSLSRWFEGGAEFRSVTDPKNIFVGNNRSQNQSFVAALQNLSENLGSQRVHWINGHFNVVARPQSEAVMMDLAGGGFKKIPLLGWHGMRSDNQARQMPHIICGRLSCIFYDHDGSGNATLANKSDFIGWVGAQVGSDLRLTDYSVVADGLSSLPQGQIDEAQPNNTNSQPDSANDRAKPCPKSHILLGLQILIGCIFLLIGTNFLREAVSESWIDQRYDAAVSGYTFGGLLLVCFGAVLIMLVGVTAHFVL